MPAAKLRPAHRRALRALAAAALCACAGAHAQTAPAAAPPKPTENSADFVLKGIVFRGMAELQDSRVSTLAAAYIGRRVTLADLEKLAEL
jgi:hemolysin activation/secretion protein